MQRIPVESIHTYLNRIEKNYSIHIGDKMIIFKQIIEFFNLSLAATIDEEGMLIGNEDRKEEVDLFEYLKAKKRMKRVLFHAFYTVDWQVFHNFKGKFFITRFDGQAHYDKIEKTHSGFKDKIILQTIWPKTVNEVVEAVLLCGVEMYWTEEIGNMIITWLSGNVYKQKNNGE